MFHLKSYNRYMFECTVDPEFDVMMGSTVDPEFQEEPYQAPKAWEIMNGFVVRRGKVTEAQPISLKGLRKRL